ncbi:hypothetical protein [Actinoallomurus acaciae]|uniref:Uncharacterized protein n=1 Tax=Actinoallomurus acaciae TaxID=502577 RepID=A0ABV5YHY4_9ACTN
MFDRVEAAVRVSGFRGCRASSVGLSAAHPVQVVVRRHPGMTGFRTFAAGRGVA